MYRPRKKPRKSSRPDDIGALCALAGVNDRSIRQWVARGLVEAPTSRGPSARYSPRAVLQVQVITHLRKQGLRLLRIEPKVKGATDEQLRAMLPGAGVAAGGALAAGASQELPATASASSAGVRCRRVVLLPGLLLLVDEDATEFVRRIADEIAARYRAS